MKMELAKEILLSNMPKNNAVLIPGQMKWIISAMEEYANKKSNQFKSEVKQKITDLASIKYLKRMRELINLGDTINVKARLLHLENAIVDDFEKYIMNTRDEHKEKEELE